MIFMRLSDSVGGGSDSSQNRHRIKFGRGKETNDQQNLFQ